MSDEERPRDMEEDGARRSKYLSRTEGTIPTTTEDANRSPSAKDTDSDSAFSDEEEARDSVPKLRSVSTASNVTMRYDLNGKGFLDDTEKAMREMDTSNRGMLDMHKVYSIMKELQEQQREQCKQQQKFLNLKRVVFALAALTALLALSNLGTAFAAARLAKDTSVDAHGALRKKGTGEEVSTVSTGTVVHVALGSGSSQPSGDRRVLKKENASTLRDEPLELWCDSQTGTASRSDVYALVEDIKKGAPNFSFEIVTHDDSGDEVTSSYFVDIIGAHWKKNDDLLQIGFKHLFRCANGQDGCQTAGYHLAPEHVQFDCKNGDEVNCLTFSCTDEEPVPLGEGFPGGLRGLLLSRFLP